MAIDWLRYFADIFIERSVSLFILIQKFAKFLNRKNRKQSRNALRMPISTPGRGSDISARAWGGLFISYWAFGDASE